MYIQTLDRKRVIEEAGYTVIEAWECDVWDELRTNDEMAEFYMNCGIYDPIRPRDALFGGRTEAIKMFHKCEPGERIEFIDVCSLYPFVLKFLKVPKGHPDIVSENFEDLATRPYFGLIKCEVLPPRGVYHPVLPAKVNGKLYFVLCKTCSITKQKGECDHTDEERAFWGLFFIFSNIK